MTFGNNLAHLGFLKKGTSSEPIVCFMASFPSLLRVAGFISEFAKQDINHSNPTFFSCTLFLLYPLLLFVLPLKRGMWLSAAQSPVLSPPEELDPQTLPHCILRRIVFQIGGTGPGSTTVSVLRAPGASFLHSLIRLAGSPIWQPKGSNLAIQLPLQ